MQQERHRLSGVVLKVQGFLPKTLRGRLVWGAAGVFILSLAFAQPAVRPKREITLTAQGVPLSVADPKLDRVGDLRYLGGAWLKSEDKGFGGLSGLSIEERNGELRILGITDEGDKLTGRLVIQDGQLRGVDAAAMEPLVNLEGAPITGKSWGDAESVSRLPDGRVLVGFEHHHRIWAYGPGLTGPARVFDTPAALQKAPANGSLESIANWPDGRVLAITEQMRTEDGNFAAFLLQDGQWSALEWTASAPGFEASDATVLPSGDLLVLERLWSVLAPMDLRSRIVRVRGDSVKPGAVLKGELVAELRAPLTEDNFEGIAAYRDASGATRLLIVSDDNFSPAQRTLLLWFEMSEPSAAKIP
jgi:hypothetical protein